eukprot:4606201-Amphidinium_carterae.1
MVKSWRLLWLRKAQKTETVCISTLIVKLSSVALKEGPKRCKGLPHQGQSAHQRAGVQRYRLVDVERK